MVKSARDPGYSDLDLDFIMHPTTKDVVKKTGDDAIKRSVRNLVLTNFYDRPFRSYVGSNVTKLLFEQISFLTSQHIKDAIKEVITNYEPRVSLIDVVVNVDNDNNGYDVIISYIILNRNQPVQINLFLEKIR